MGEIALVLAAAGLGVVPLLIRGASCGQDFDFHVQSWMAVASQWRSGVVYPRWIDGANFGAGEARFVFYPPLSWELGALLGSVLPWAWVPAAFSFVALALAGLAVWRVGRGWTASGVGGVAAAWATMFSPYVLFAAYERTAFAELLAGVWVPWIFRFAGRGGTTAWLAVVVAGVWLTNAPAAVMCCYLAAGLAVGSAWMERDWRPVWRAGVGVVWGLGLAAFYVLPAAYERRWVAIERALDVGMRVEDSWLFGRTGMEYHDAVLRTASWAVVATVLGILAAGVAAGRLGASRRALGVLAVVAGGIFALQFRWSGWVWRVLPELRFLQFPWRWALVLSVVLGLMVAAAVGAAGRHPAFRRRGWVLGVAGVVWAAGMGAMAAGTYWQACDEEDAVGAQAALFQSGRGYEGTDEYAVAGADNSLIQRGLPLVRVVRGVDGDGADEGEPEYMAKRAELLKAQVRIEEWSTYSKRFAVTADERGYAVLRLADFPAWRVRVDGVLRVEEFRRMDGLMVVALPRGVSRVEVEYMATPDVLAGRVVSGVSVLALASVGFGGGRWRRILGWGRL